MHLIVATPTTEDINIKMSSQTENSVNGIINEIKHDLNQVFLKNEESATTNIEETLNDELPVSEISNGIEDSLGSSKSNDGNQNCTLENTTETLEKLRDIAPETTTNGTAEIPNTNETENETHNQEIINQDKILDDDQVCQSNISESVACLSEPDVEPKIANESLCENYETLDECSNNTSTNIEIDTSVNNLENDKVNADDNTTREKLSNSEGSKSIDDSTKQENSDNETASIPIDAIDLDDVVMNDVSKSSEESVNIADSTKQTEHVNKETNDLQLSTDELSEDVAMEDINATNTGIEAKLSDTHHSKDIKLNEAVLPSVETDENIDSNEESNSKLIHSAEKFLESMQEDCNHDKFTSDDKNLEEIKEITMIDPVTNATEEIKDDDSNIISDTCQVNDTLLVNSEENKVPDNINNESMEVDDDTEIIVENKSSENSDKSSNTSLKEQDPIVVDITESEVISEVDGKDKNTDNNTKVDTEDKSDMISKLVPEKIYSENIIVSEDLSDNDTSPTKNKKCYNDLTDDKESVEIIDEDDVKFVEDNSMEEIEKAKQEQNSSESQKTKSLPVVCKLSNTLNILSDDEDEAPNVESNVTQNKPEEKQCINIDDDDDIMLIEDSDYKDKSEVNNKKETTSKSSDKIDEETGEKNTTDITDLMPKVNDKEKPTPPEDTTSSKPESTRNVENKADDEEIKKPLLPKNFLKTAKKNLAGMTRHELEDFCILRIVESIVDRSNLGDIKTKIKTMAQNLEDYKKRAMMMAKQNRDLQVVLKSVQEEQKKQTNAPIQPLKITRSVGMQVLVSEKPDPRRKAPIPNSQPPATSAAGRPIRATQSAKQIKPPAAPANIPVPRKVPVSNSPAKANSNTTVNNVVNKSASPISNGLRNPSPVQKVPEKRTHGRMQSTSSVTVDLTDDEPPAKIINKSSPSQPVRVVPPQNLLAQQRQFPPINNARKVYIPISGPQAQVRPGQTIVMKTPHVGPRPGQRLQTAPRPQQNQVRPKASARHPAPLPESMKQYTPPTWKSLPPAPDLKLSKVENGIVISWKIDGYPEGDYETIASYQLYAYQETSAPPCTALWKKIGDVKALPLPMACTLTQFMAGFKYYFAVRAVDIRSRLGPFSLPGSILLINKM